jgi:hypothetical protein
LTYTENTDQIFDAIDWSRRAVRSLIAAGFILVASSGSAFAAYQPSSVSAPKASASTDEKLVAESHYVCTPSGFGRKATCKLMQ